jgi:hypothetical protein
LGRKKRINIRKMPVPERRRNKGIVFCKRRHATCTGVQFFGIDFYRCVKMTRKI